MCGATRSQEALPGLAELALRYGAHSAIASAVTLCEMAHARSGP
jgi:hypothetical protein